MNKTKMILAGTGGVTLLAVLVMAYFTWGAYSAKTAAMEGDDEEGVEGLETVVGKAQELSRKPVYPCASSLAAIESNRTLVTEWRVEAAKLAARGDKAFAKTTPPAFKTFIESDAKRLAALPGVVGGVLVKPDFAFGPFKDYITGGMMPSEAQLAELQRKWDDVATITETLAKCGISELLDVQFKAADAKEGDDDSRRQQKKQKSKDKKAESEVQAPSSFTYVFTFDVKPVAFVKTMNALETCERFVTVEGFTFTRGKDLISEALSGEEKNADQKNRPRRGRRGRGGNADVEVAAEEKEKQEAKNRIITDPLLDAPLTVVMTVTVHDFRSLEGEKAEVEEVKQ